VIAQRTLAVLSAILLVGAVALATLGPGTTSLGRALFQLDPNLPENLHGWLERTLGTWTWANVVLPMMLRPAWLLPASFGLICVGLSFSVSNRKSAHRSHRRS
jgi:hypothetical protein